MYRRFFNWIIQFPSTIIVSTLLLALLSGFLAKEGLIDEDGLRMDTTIKPFNKQGKGTAYEFYSSLEDRGFYNNLTVEELASENKKKELGIAAEGEEEIEETIFLVLKRGEHQKMDLNFFLNLEKWTQQLGAEPEVGASSISSLLTAEYLDGPCIGKPLIYQPSIGSVCESVLHLHHEQLECIQNKEVHREAYEQSQAAAEEEEFDFEEEDEEEEDEEDESFYEEFVCTPDILEKSESELIAETERKIAQIVEEIKRQKLLHKRVISEDFQTSLFSFGLLKGTDFRTFAEKKLPQYLQQMRDQGFELGWLSGQRGKNVIKDYASADMKTILPATVFLMLFSLYLSFRNISGMLLPFTVVTIALVMVGGVIGVTGTTLNTLTSAIPALLICVGNDYAIHFLNYYVRAARLEPEKSKKELVVGVLNHLLVPLSVTALTTVGGFSALMISDIPAISDLGLFASIGVILSIFTTLTFLPATLLVLPRPKPIDEAKRDQKTLLDKSLDVLANSVRRSPARVMIFWAILILFFSAGLGLINFNGDSNPVDPSHPMMQDKQFYSDNFSGARNLMITLSGKDSPDQLQTAETINGILSFKNWVLDPNNEAINNIKGLRVDRVDSVLDFIDLSRNGLDNLQDKEVVTHFQTSRRYDWKPYLSADQQMMLVEVRYEGETVPIRLEFSKLVMEKFPEFLPNIDFRFTGKNLLFAEAQNNLARGQLQSVVLALAFVFVILSILFMSIKIGFLSLLPNVIPVVIFFGTVGFLSIPIGFTVSIIAAIVLGIGVDDTIHYLTHHNENVKKLRDEKKAALFTIRQVGRPMTYTTISLGLGFIIFLLSETFHQKVFGMLTAYTFVICLLTDTHFLPAMMSKVKMITAWDYAALQLNEAMLKTVSLFQNMTLREAKQATLMAFTIDLKKGDILFKQNDQGDELYVVLQGELEYYLDPEFHSEKKILAHHKVGDTVGEMGLFGNSKRLATVQAVEDSQVLVLKLEHLMTYVFQRNPKIATRLFVNLANKLALDTKEAGEEIARRKITALVEAQQNPEKYLQELKNLVDKIVEDGVLEVEEQMAIERLVYADGVVSPEEQEQLDRVNHMLAEGTLKAEKTLEELVDDIIDDGVVTTDELKELHDRIYDDNYVTQEEQEQLDRLDQLIEEGKLIKQDPIYAGIFQQMSQKQIRWLKKNFEVKSFPNGARVFSQGDYGDYMLVILKGKFQIEAYKFGQKAIVATVFEGDVIGGFALLCKDYIRPSSIIASGDTEVLFISEQGLQMMIEKNKKIAARFYHNLLCMLSERLERSIKLLYE